MPLCGCKQREMIRGQLCSSYHVLWLFGEEGDGARAITLDILLDEAHFVPRSLQIMVWSLIMRVKLLEVLRAI
jgi:hypothetical protein